MTGTEERRVTEDEGTKEDTGKRTEGATIYGTDVKKNRQSHGYGDLRLSTVTVTDGAVDGKAEEG